jgi:hypothetical protein
MPPNIFRDETSRMTDGQALQPYGGFILWTSSKQRTNAETKLRTQWPRSNKNKHMEKCLIYGECLHGIGLSGPHLLWPMPFSNKSLCRMPYAYDSPTLDAADSESTLIPLQWLIATVLEDCSSLAHSRVKRKSSGALDHSVLKRSSSLSE